MFIIIQGKKAKKDAKVSASEGISINWGDRTQYTKRKRRKIKMSQVAIMKLRS